MTSLRRLFVCLAIPLLVLPLGSCGFGGASYAVILWSEDVEALPNGTVARIVEESQIESTVSLRLTDSRDTFVVDEWRIEVFDEQQQAEDYAAEIRPFADRFALAGRNALPVREEPDRMSGIVYRLRDREEVRILGRSEQESDEAGFVDYWYEVLTREGIPGWVFGYYLVVPTNSPEAAPEDPKLATILSTVWRPVYFPEMIESRRYDLKRFRPDIGFFPYPEERRFEIDLVGGSAEFEFESISEAAFNEYVARGTSLQITYRNEQTISIQDDANGEGYNMALERVDADIEALIEEERERRQAIRAELISRGPILRSDSYGTIALESDGTLEWIGFDALVPRVFPPETTGTGRISFDLYVSERFDDRYDGAGTLAMRTDDGFTEIPLLYVYTTSGIRLIPLTDQEVRKNLVIAEPLTPLVLFFSFSE